MAGTQGFKRARAQDAATHDPQTSRAPKKARLLDDSDSDSDGEAAPDGAINVNEEYARRFEHNKKREEQHRLEEKYGRSTGLESEDDESEDSEEGVEEDDAGEFATEALDDEISATLNALRAKDPRIYNKEVQFYKDTDEPLTNGSNGKKEQAMTLKQYHTKNLLDGKFAGEDDDAPPRTYAQEQEDVRQNLLKEANAASSDDNNEDGDFLVAKPKDEEPKHERVKITQHDIKEADKDPETFLSNFLAARAWVPTRDAHFQQIESDNEDDEAAAEEWENSYNMYFEDPTGVNEKLVTYARDAVANTTVRRGDTSARHKAREAARAKRDAERKAKEEEVARLRKLKIDEMEEKVKKIRKTGGLSGKNFDMNEWKDVLEADWSDDQWDEEMRRRFGEAYYEEQDADGSSSEEENGGKGKKKKQPKKPKFDDDIDIKDIVPDFEDEEQQRPSYTLSSDEDGEGQEEDALSTKSAMSSKKRKQERADAKSAARRDRRLIENLVDSNLEYEAALAAKPKAPTGFRYRETSPTTFGLTPRDILLASDSQLNEFAGLKKLAAFRDPDKKKKDKKYLSKKARLRQWRADTFGDAEGPKGGFEVLLGDDARAADANIRDPRRKGGNGKVDNNIIEGNGEGKRKKKRNRKRKSAAAES